MKPRLEPLFINDVFNRIGVSALIGKEVRRFFVVWVQAIFGPVISTLLYLAIFAVVMKNRPLDFQGVAYMDFLAPGLIMMAILQNAFANSSSSILISKVNGTISDVLAAPLTPSEFVCGYIVGGVIRGLMVGLVLTLILAPFGLIAVKSIGLILGFSLLGAILFAALGLVSGVYAEKMEHISFVSSIVIAPLTILSGTFYSISSLPSQLQFISKGNPIFYLLDGFRAGFIGSHEGSILIGFTLLCCLGAIAVLICIGMVSKGYRLKY
jgi:ABC-2 type transport system permease protein